MKNAALGLLLFSSVVLTGCASVDSADNALVAAAPAKKEDAMSNAQIHTGSRIPSGNNGQTVATTTGKSYLESLDNKSVQTDFH